MSFDFSKNIGWYAFSLIISLSYFCVFLIVNVIAPSFTGYGNVDVAIVSYLLILPLIILYIIGFYFYKTSSKKRRKITGWILNLYAFSYIFVLIFLFLSFGECSSSLGGAISGFPPYIINSLFILWNLIIIYYLFIGLLFYVNKMKKHQLGAILCVVLLIGISLMAAEGATSNNNVQRYLVGQVVYLSNQSNPENPDIGVWFRLVLSEPNKLSLTNFYIVLWYNHGKNEDFINFEFMGKNKAHECNYTAEFYDTNRDGYITTGDMVHIYGEKLNNISLAFCEHGYIGCLRIDVPSEDETRVNSAYIEDDYIKIRNVMEVFFMNEAI
ncbi:MAG: hypothetical protein GXO25_00555 [Euryarchaeota archaeon]|nr:hypothetical protein [Euryarchaeota archaeon]